MKQLFNTLVANFTNVFNTSGDLTNIIFGGLIALPLTIFGAWLGIWILLAGGAMDVVEVFRGEGGAGKLLWGIIKFSISGIGWVFVYIGALIGGSIAAK